MTANDNYSYSLWNEHFKYEIIKRNISQREAMVFAKSLNKLTGKL